MVQNLRSRLRGCLHYTGATFAQDRVHSGSLSWLYIQLHDTTTKRHAGGIHPSVISPLLLYRGENLSPVRNLATVSCIRETTRRFGVPIDWNWKHTRNVFAILNHTCILSTWSVPSNSEIRKWRSHHVNAIRNLKFIPVWNSRWCEFSRVNIRLFNPLLGLAAAYPGRGVLGWASES